MSKKTIVFFEMKGDQFRKDIKEKLRHPLVYPQLPKKAKGLKAVVGKEEPLSLRVVAEVDEGMYKALAADALLLDQMREEFLPLYGQCCEAIASAYEVANAKFAANILDGDKAAASALAEESKKIKVLVDKMGAAAQKVWDARQKTNSDYAKYQFKIVTTLTLASITLIAGIAIVASTPFHFGVGTVFGIIGMVKSSAVIVTELGNAYKEPIEALESAEKLLLKIFAGMEKDGKYNKKWKAKQYTAEILNTATQVALSVEKLPSLSKLKDKITLADNKVKGVDVKMHKIGKKITEYSKRFDTYEKETKPTLAKMIAENDVSQGYDPVAMDLYLETVKQKTELKLAHQFEKLAKIQVDYADMKKRLGALHEVLDIMLQKPEVRNLARFGEVMEYVALAGNLGMAGAGCASFDTSATVEFATHAGDIAGAVITGATSDLTGEAASKIAGLIPVAQHQFEASLG
jgi:hypothetical protein